MRTRGAQFLRITWAVIVLLATSRCHMLDGLISCYGCGGGGGFLPAAGTPASSIPISLVFQISSSSSAQPVAGDTIKVTEDRVRQFLSFGIADFSRVYGMSPTHWKVDISKPKRRLSRDEQFLAELGLPARSEPVSKDQHLMAMVRSPESTTLSAVVSQGSAIALIKTDTKYSDKREYRTHFFGFVHATYRPERPGILFFDVSINAYLEGKSKYADEDAFRPVQDFNQVQARAWQEAVGKDLLSAYVRELQGLGFKVEPKVEK